MTAVVVRIQRLRADAQLPTFATEGSAGLDLAAAMDEPVMIHPGRRTLVPTGLVLALPRGFEGQVRPRSGLALRRGVTVLNAPGTIDSDYRGELRVLLVNFGEELHTIQPGDRVAQLVVAPVLSLGQVELRVEDELDATARGQGGFGSTDASLPDACQPIIESA